MKSFFQSKSIALVGLMIGAIVLSVSERFNVDVGSLYEILQNVDFKAGDIVGTITAVLMAITRTVTTQPIQGMQPNPNRIMPRITDIKTRSFVAREYVVKSGIFGISIYFIYRILMFIFL